MKKKKIAKEKKTTKTPKRIKLEKKILTPPAPVEQSQPVAKNRPETVVFYGHNIRRIPIDRQWFFSIEDILKVAYVVNPVKFIISLKNHDSLNDRYFQLVETYSYYEEGNPVVLPIVSYQS